LCEYVPWIMGKVRPDEAECMMAILAQWDAQLQHSSMKLKSLQLTYMEQMHCMHCARDMIGQHT